MGAILFVEDQIDLLIVIRYNFIHLHIAYMYIRSIVDGLVYSSLMYFMYFCPFHCSCQHRKIFSSIRDFSLQFETTTAPKSGNIC